jgi:adenylate cyclase
VTVLRKLLGGLLVGLLVAAAVFVDAWELAELAALDRFFRLRGPTATTTPIVIVTIDEDSFDELNLAWPFPRALHGTLLEFIAAGGPRAIGIDLLFPEPSIRGDADDADLAEAVTRAKTVVLGAAITTMSEGFYQKTDVNFPIPAIRKGAAAVAPINLNKDSDAVVRRVLLRHATGGGANADEVLDGVNLALYRLAAKSGLPVAPLPAADEVLINFRGGRRSFPWVSYHRVVNGDIDPAVFRDKIVLVGATTHVLHDVFATPFERGGTMPGVEIHAHAIETLVRGDRVQEVPWQVSTALAVLLAPLAAWLVARFRAVRAFAAVTALLLTLLVAAFLLFALANVWVMIVMPGVALVLGYVAASTENFIRDQRERRRLSQFFSPDVLREIVRHREGVNLGSSRRLVTVFFSDLRGFTSLSEQMEPEIVADMLREYLSEMTEVVFRNGGTVDKYIGDCVMAIWNAPFEDPQHAAKAVRTALDFQERTLAVSARWEEKLGGKIRNGCGINTGEAVVGTMGSRQRLEYTAIGDTVNLAARLESITKDYNASIIISESTYEYVKGAFMTRELGAVTVKGKTRPVRIFAVLPADIRRHPRSALDTAATVTVAGLDESFVVRTRDISETGIALVGVPHSLDKGTTIEVRCEGGGLPRPLAALGIVVWRRGDAVGVEFLDGGGDAPPAVSTDAASHDKVETS